MHPETYEPDRLPADARIRCVRDAEIAALLKNARVSVLFDLMASVLKFGIATVVCGVRCFEAQPDALLRSEERIGEFADGFSMFGCCPREETLGALLEKGGSVGRS